MARTKNDKNKTNKLSATPQKSNKSEGGQQQTGISRRGENSVGTPFGFMRRFGEEMDRLFEDFGLSGRGLTPSIADRLDRLGLTGSAMWSPQVEVFERDNQLIVRADLPGLSRDNVDVEINDDALVIRGERNDERERQDEGYYRSERSYGSFYRSIPLPDGVIAEDATADFRNGVLEITLPTTKRAESRQRRVEIREANETERQSPNKARAAGQNK